MEILEVAVEGVKCRRCCEKIEDVVKLVNGVDSVQMDLARKRATVYGKARLEEVRSAVESLGYKVLSLEVRDAEGYRVDLGRYSPERLGDGVANEGIELRDISIFREDGSSPSKVDYVVFNVRGMTCKSCASKIEEHLRGLSGVVSVHVGFLVNQVEVRYVTHLQTPENIRFELVKLGYPAKVLVTRRDVLLLSVWSGSLEVAGDELKRDLCEKKGIKEVKIEEENRIRVVYDSMHIGARDILSIVSGEYKLGTTLADERESPVAEQELAMYKKKMVQCAIFGGLVTLLMGLMWFPEVAEALMKPRVYVLSIEDLVMFTCATVIQFWVADHFYVSSWTALKNKRSNMNMLILLATLCAYFYSFFVMLSYLFNPSSGEHPETFFDVPGMMIPIVLTGRYLECVAKGKLSKTIRSLSKTNQETYLLTTGEFRNGRFVEAGPDRVIDSRLIQRGDVIRILRGNVIPVDGEIVDGESTINESVLTGESIPVVKSVGDDVYAQTTNEEDTILVRAVSVGNNTQAAQIMQYMRDTQGEKAAIERFADTVAEYMIPTVLALSAIAFVVWFLLGAFHVFVPPNNTTSFQFALLRAISVLVITCPCAFGLATPTAVAVGTDVGAKLGIIFKGGRYLETAHRLTSICFDKTGTLTLGTLHVALYELFDLEKYFPTLDPQMFHQLVRTAESNVKHPISKAIIHYLSTQIFVQPAPGSREPNASFQPKHLSNVVVLDGLGIKCLALGQYEMAIGNRRLMNELKCHLPDSVQLRLLVLEQQMTCVLVSLNRVVVAIFGLTNRLRPDASFVVHALSKQGIDVWLLSGDTNFVVDVAAKQVGIQNVLSSALPIDKAEKIKEIQTSRGRSVVGMVGDGVNDLPALQAADIGIIIGAGQNTNMSTEAVNIALLKNNLVDLLTAMDLSKKTFQKIQFNYIWAMGYNLVEIPLAAGVFYPLGITLSPILAGIFMALSSLSVIFSSLTLHWYKKTDQVVQIERIVSQTLSSSRSMP
ncbi:uncharacterized protein LOC126325911 [Schistocerca gregaria]|uniref:uncharacterized protein LOC126325911 n=1 Tax=Schistocerca gregaria TaxID=7010 RepID=UPI00211DB3C6|nr:uncharacterized protein LOC126325911 [Schistocerca gregaria]